MVKEIFKKIADIFEEIVAIKFYVDRRRGLRQINKFMEKQEKKQ